MEKRKCSCSGGVVTTDYGRKRRSVRAQKIRKSRLRKSHRKTKRSPRRRR